WSFTSTNFMKPRSFSRGDSAIFMVVCETSTNSVTQASLGFSRGRPGPDPALLQERDLLFNDVAAAFGVLHRRAVQVQSLRIDRLLVDELVLLGHEILHPVVPLRAGAEVAQRLDVDGADDVRRRARVLVPPDEVPLVVADHVAAAEGVDRRVAALVQVVRGE